MAWMISVALLIVGCVKGVDVYIIASGLFAICGAISSFAMVYKNKPALNEHHTTNDE